MIRIGELTSQRLALQHLYKCEVRASGRLPQYGLAEDRLAHPPAPTQQQSSAPAITTPSTPTETRGEEAAREGPGTQAVVQVAEGGLG